MVDYSVLLIMDIVKDTNKRIKSLELKIDFLTKVIKSMQNDIDSIKEKIY